MKQYHQHYKNTTTDVNRSTKTIVKQVPQEPSASARAPFLLGVHLDTHISSQPDPYNDLDRFLTQSFKEYEKWLNDTELKHAQMAYHYRGTYQPTVFPPNFVQTKTPQPIETQIPIKPLPTKAWKPLHD
jgi:hypothetical protein